MTDQIIVVDLETTGFTPPDHRVIEIGETRMVGDPATGQWAIGQGWDSRLFDPGMAIPPEASAVHHLVDEDVAGRPSWESFVLDRPWADVPRVAFAAHNCAFERQWIDEHLAGDTPWICTYRCALRLWPEAPSHSNQALRYWRRLAVDPMARRLIGDEAHRAGPDSWVTAHLLRAMLAEATVDQLIAWSAEPALQIRVGFGKHRGQRWRDLDDGYLHWVLRQDFDEDVRFTAMHELRSRGVEE